MKAKFSILPLLALYFHCIGFVLPKSTNSNSISGTSLLALFSSSTTNNTSTSAQVGPEGAVVESSNGSFVMEIPAGALSETRQITITRESSPIGQIPEGNGKRTTVFKFEPEGLVFAKPALLTVFYDQGEMPEATFEERSIGFYYIKNDSTLEKMKTVSVDYAQNKITVEVKHFSFGVGLTVQVWLVTNGIVTNPVPVTNIANNVITELGTFSSNGYPSVGAYFQANVGILGPFLNQLVSILGYDPVSTAFPSADFDGDGIPNSEDPFVPSTGPQVTLVSNGSLNVSANAGAINTTQFVWSSSKSGSFSVRKGATDCLTGTVVSTGSVAANVNQNSGTLSASSNLTIGTNVYRICVVSSGVTGAASLSFLRDDSLPSVSVNPNAGNYGTVQNVSLNCGDTGGAGCSKIAYTTNGSTPSFTSACAITNGTQYAMPITTPDSAVTTIKYKSCDNGGNISILYSQSYTVDSVLPSITINSTLPGLIIQGSVSPQFNWQSDKDGNYTVKIGADCGSGILAAGTNVSGSVTSGVALTTTVNSGAQLADGSRKINFCVSNLIGNVGTSSTTITVDSVIPTLTITPNAGTYTPVQTITATCSDATSGCQKIIYTMNGSAPTMDASGAITNGSLYTGSLTTPNNTTTTYKFLARDNAGLTSGISTLTYNIGTPPVCGNGNIEGVEQCDDGNTASGDGCSSLCQVETNFPWVCSNASPSVCTINYVCGNGIIEGTEQCDGGAVCNSNCTINTALLPPAPSIIQFFQDIPLWIQIANPSSTRTIRLYYKTSSGVSKNNNYVTGSPEPDNLNYSFENIPVPINSIFFFRLSTIVNGIESDLSSENSVRNACLGWTPQSPVCI